jgi:hypothetical protein
MTGVNDNRTQRISESKGREVSQGVSADGNQDPRGEFPNPQYWNSQNINYAATGNKSNELYIGGSEKSINLGLTENKASQYPYNQVSETISGHVIEVDDTPGGERMLFKHRTGAGIELRPDGTVIISSTKNKIEVTGDDHNVIVEGDGNLVYKGNLNIKVTGEFNVECTDFNVKTNGNMNTNVIGSQRTTVGETKSDTVRGGLSQTVAQQVTNTYLGGLSTNVKGTLSNNVEGAANYVSSENTVISSETKIDQASPDINIAAENLSVFGDTGTIGGENIIMYNYNMYSGHSIWSTETVNTKTVTATKTVNAIRMFADTFEGDLDGTADIAATSLHQSYPDGTSPYYSPNVGSRGSITNTAAEDATFDTTATALPTDDLLTAYLNNSNNGVKTVSIDDGDFIKKNINKTDVYGGLSDLNLTTGLVRSRLRDPNNANVTDFTTQAVAEGVLSENYIKVAPPGIGRVVSANSTPKFGQIKFGNVKISTNADPFLATNLTASILPDPLYNPDFALSITSSTKLSPGVSIAKFLGSTGHPTNLTFIKDELQLRQLGRQLYMQAELIRSIAMNKAAFANYRLIVQEGVYRPGPSETASGLNMQKLKGEAVVYDLIDNDGQSDPVALFDLAEYWKDTLLFDKMILS